MKPKCFIFCFIFLISTTVTAQSVKKPPFDLPPDASSEQLWRVIEMQGGYQSFNLSPFSRGPIEEAIEYGLRNMAWLKLINQNRPQGTQISLTSKATTGGYPIEQPSEYSPGIVGERLAKLKTDMPAEMREVIVDGKPLTTQLPVSVESFIEWGRTTDRIYQTALRWQGNQNWLSWYERARANDIRGIYFLNKLGEVERTRRLEHAADLNADLRTELSDWLVSLCMNNGASLEVCRGNVTQSMATGESLMPLYEGWSTAAQSVYDQNFTVSNARVDVVFNASELLQMPFREPADAKVLAFLRDNIEDEWRFSAWSLKLLFTTDAAARAEWLPGVTPHVNELGGDVITMNADQPLTEYDARWTIRHEFGHVIGLPDCYVEYYDTERQVMVTYQIDIDNLMCSRHGHIQQKHVDELKRAYFRP